MNQIRKKHRIPTWPLKKKGHRTNPSAILKMDGLLEISPSFLVNTLGFLFQGETVTWMKPVWVTGFLWCMNLHMPLESWEGATPGAQIPSKNLPSTLQFYWHGNGKCPFSIGNTSSTGPFSITTLSMLLYQRVDSLPCQLCANFSLLRCFGVEM